MNNGLFVLGVVLIVLGFISYGYTVGNNISYLLGVYQEASGTQPYQDWAVPLFVAGIIGMIVGAALPEMRTITTDRVVVREEVMPRHRKHIRTVVNEAEA
jgi:membrane-bound ClpP family serine protease